jgi:hypothetical protein
MDPSLPLLLQALIICGDLRDLRFLLVIGARESGIARVPIFSTVTAVNGQMPDDRC